MRKETNKLTFSDKLTSIQFKFLITIVSAMIAVTIFVGGIAIYEVDNYVRKESEEFVNVSCANETAQINDIFGDMEKSVKIMESYIYGLFETRTEILDRNNQKEIIDSIEEMYIDVAKYTSGAIAYYFRFAPEVSDFKTGIFYSKLSDRDEFVKFEVTDISLYDNSDTEHVGWYWEPYEAQKPIWMKPYYNQNNNILMISYVIPLYFKNQFIGVVGMDFDYNILSDRVHNIKIYENGFAHLELDGVVIDDENNSVKEASVSDKYLSVSDKLVNGMTLVFSASYDDIRHIRYEIAFKILFVTILITLFFAAIVIFIIKKITNPLSELTKAATKLSSGDYDIELKHSDTYEIKLLRNAFENMASHLYENEKLQHLLAYRDSLTGLRNTTSYKAWLNDFNREIEAGQSDFGIIVFDVNYLKETNDKYGHDVGNKLIVAVAKIISEIFKRSPVFRIGGDEFLAILQNKDLEEYKELLESFDLKTANTFVETEKGNIKISVAKGFTRFDANKDANFTDIFNRADYVMYQNKREMKSVKK